MVPVPTDQKTQFSCADLPWLRLALAQCCAASDPDHFGAASRRAHRLPGSSFARPLKLFRECGDELMARGSNEHGSLLPWHRIPEVRLRCYECLGPNALRRVVEKADASRALCVVRTGIAPSALGSNSPAAPVRRVRSCTRPRQRHRLGSHTGAVQRRSCCQNGCLPAEPASRSMGLA